MSPKYVGDSKSNHVDYQFDLVYFENKFLAKEKNDLDNKDIVT